MKLNKLEQRIADECGFKSIAGLGYSNSDLNAIQIAAKIALELAEKAYGSGYWLGEHNQDGVECLEGFDQFKRDIL